MMKLVVVIAALMGASRASAQDAVLQTPMQALIETQTASEVALIASETAAVASVRADPKWSVNQRRAVLKDIREDFQAMSKTMTKRHAANKKAMLVASR